MEENRVIVHSVNIGLNDGEISSDSDVCLMKKAAENSGNITVVHLNPPNLQPPWYPGLDGFAQDLNVSIALQCAGFPVRLIRSMPGREDMRNLDIGIVSNFAYLDILPSQLADKMYLSADAIQMLFQQLGHPEVPSGDFRMECVRNQNDGSISFGCTPNRPANGQLLTKVEYEEVQRIIQPVIDVLTLAFGRQAAAEMQEKASRTIPEERLEEIRVSNPTLAHHVESWNCSVDHMRTQARKLTEEARMHREHVDGLLRDRAPALIARLKA